MKRKTAFLWIVSLLALNAAAIIVYMIVKEKNDMIHILEDCCEELEGDLFDLRKKRDRGE